MQKINYNWLKQFTTDLNIAEGEKKVILTSAAYQQQKNLLAYVMPIQKTLYITKLDKNLCNLGKELDHINYCTIYPFCNVICQNG